MLPDSAHDLQGPLQAVAQQTPWAHTAEAHSAAAEQKAPMGFFPHELAVQTFPAVQFVSAVHWEKHRLPLQAKGTQVTASGATQCPVASQADSGVNTLLSQCSGAQTVPVLYRRHAPAPSQRPSVPQEEAGWATQVCRGSAAPAGTDVHEPIADGSAQVRQAPWQAPSQQTPSTQKPLEHSVAPAHA